MGYTSSSVPLRGRAFKRRRGFFKGSAGEQRSFETRACKYTQRWHDLATVCIPTQNENHKKNGAQPNLKNVAVHQDPMDLNPASVVHLSGMAVACDNPSRSVDLKLFPAARSSPCDETEEQDNIVTALHSLVTAVQVFLSNKLPPFPIYKWQAFNCIKFCKYACVTF